MAYGKPLTFGPFRMDPSTESVWRGSEEIRLRPKTFGGHDAGTCCRSQLARAQWLLGYPDRARAAMRDALALAERLAHPATTVHMLGTVGAVAYQLGDWRTAGDCGRRMLALAQGQGFATFVQDAATVLACGSNRAGMGGDLGALYDQMMTPTVVRFTSTRRLISRIILADATAAVGDGERALRLLDTIPVEHRDAIYAPKTRRIRGDVLASRGQREDRNARSARRSRSPGVAPSGRSSCAPRRVSRACSLEADGETRHAAPCTRSTPGSRKASTPRTFVRRAACSTSSGNRRPERAAERKGRATDGRRRNRRPSEA
jgi:hypothetical protein